MKIRWISHPHKPELNGTEQHVARELATVACGYGQAEIVPPARRGTPEWLEEMKARSAAATTPDPNDVRPPFFDAPVWSVTTKQSGTVYVEKRFKSEITRFEVPPADCPTAIVEQYAALKNIDPAAGALAIDAAKRAQADYDNRILTARKW